MAVQSQIIGPLTGAAAAGSAMAGPVVSGPRAGQDSAGNPANQGLATLMQQVTLNANGSNVVSATINVPRHSVIMDITVDTTTLFNSATSNTVSVGTTAGGTQYASGVDVKTAAAATPRQRPAFTAAQLGAMADTGSTEAIVVTMTPVGSAAAGQCVVSIEYAQTINWQNP